MITWAYVWFGVKMKGVYAVNGLGFCIAAGCDVAIFYYVAQAAAAFR